MPGKIVPIGEPTCGVYDEPWPDAQQTSLRIGYYTLPRTHGDIHKLAIANEILGGYFGSRLMKNIREDKGYTYGIYSKVSHMRYSSYWQIASEINKEHRLDALNEIRNEVNRLREEIVSDDELNLVKNYMLGSFLNHQNSVFNRMYLFKVVLLNQLDKNYFVDRISTINNITGANLRDTYRNYFFVDSAVIVLMG